MDQHIRRHGPDLAHNNFTGFAPSIAAAAAATAVAEHDSR